MKKIIGAILIIASLGMGYVGFNKVSQSSESVKLLGVEITASDESVRQEGFIFLGLAVILFIGRIYTLNSAKK